MLGLRHARGVSLVELIIGIAIVSILLMTGLPSFSQWLQNAQVRAAAESIQNGLQTARNEAVRRNTQVQFRLTSATGLVDWNVGCVIETDDCPAVIQQRSGAEGGTNARVGISTEAPPSPVPADQYAAALSAGTGLSDGANVTFNGLGAIPAANIGTDITRIDITNAVADDARRLVVIIGTGGLIRMCDPALSLSANPQGCS
jgi:type IV fimbrial biogenesis protein FimT